jgi:hypothetical protein
MVKPTVRATRQKVSELLALQASYERYQLLEKEVKADMVELKYREFDLPGQGRVFISEAERRSVDPAQAIRMLGDDLANKIIQVKKVVSLKLFDAFVEVGDISPEAYKKLIKTEPRVALHVRPLK